MTKTALIIVDLQNDFLKGGALEVKEGNAIIPIINQLLNQSFDLKVASKDWHPKDHSSFNLWPPHCIQDTLGAEFPKELNADKIEKVFYKGQKKEVDSYSAFFDVEKETSTGLDEYLKQAKIDELFISGLATDFCVKETVLDALKLGFKTHLIVDACKAVYDHERAVEEMRQAGALLVSTSRILL